MNVEVKEDNASKSFGGGGGGEGRRAFEAQVCQVEEGKSEER